MSRSNTLRRHGFESPSYVKPTDYDNFVKDYSQVHNHRQYRWEKYNLHEFPKRGFRLKRFCRKGIPADYRPQVWMYISGADRRLADNPGVYAAAANGQPPENLRNVILSDIHRTFPENTHFRDHNSPQSMLTSLQRVLTAFAVQFPQVGYCQGLNYITAIMLLVMHGPSAREVEEKTFWLLDALINRTVVNYYSNLALVRVDCMVLGELVNSKAPEVHRLVKEFGINYTVLCTKWFICLFADVLPIETSLRVLDCLFYEGDKVLFRAGLTLILLHRNSLVQCTDFPQLMNTFRIMCQDQQTLRCHEFVKAMFTLPGSLSRNTIRRLRIRCENRLAAGEEG